MKKENKYIVGIIVGIAVIILAVSIANNLSFNSNSRDYISKNQTQCAASDWMCDPGMQQFYDETGCGCEKAKSNEEFNIN